MSRIRPSTLLPRLAVVVSLALGLAGLVFAQDAPREGEEPRATPPWANRATPEAAGVDEAETPSWIEVETRLHALLRGVEDDPQAAPRRLSSWTQDFFEQAAGETLDAESYARLIEPLGSGPAGVIPGTINRDGSQPRRPLSGYRCLDQVHRNLVDQLVAVDRQTLMPLVWIHFNAHLEQLEADLPWLSDSSRALTFSLIGRLGSGGEEGQALEAAFRVAWAEHLLGRKVYDDGLRAAEVLERVVDDLAEGQPGRDDARYVAAYLLEKYGYYGRALRHFERLSEVWPDDPEIRLRTAMNRLRQGNTRLGEADLQALAQGQGVGDDSPSVPDWVRQVAYGELIRSLAREPEEARRMARKALDQFPGDPSLRTQLAFHLWTEDWSETLGQLARIESVGPGSGLSPRGVYDLAREGDFERNRRRIAEALEQFLPRLSAALDQVERDWKRWPDLRAVEPSCDDWAAGAESSEGGTVGGERVGVVAPSEGGAAPGATPLGALAQDEPKVWHYSVTPEDAGVVRDHVPLAIQAENELLRLLTETLDDPEAAIRELNAFQQSVLDRVAMVSVDADFMSGPPVTEIPGLNCLRRLEVSVFDQLAAIDPEVQVPLAVLLTDTYRHQVGPPRQTWLTEHSHQMAQRFVERYRRGRDPEADDLPAGIQSEASAGEPAPPAALTAEELEARRPVAIALLLELADQQRRAGSYHDGGEALELFERILRLDSGHSISRYFAGYLAEKYAFYPRARRHFEALAKRQPDDVEARLRLALNQSRTGAKVKAEEGLRWVSSSGTDSWLHRLAFHELVRLAGDDPRRASTELASAKARFPDDPVLRIQSAYHLRQAAWDASVEELYRAEESLGGGEETARVRYEFPRDDGLAENRAEIDRQVAQRLPNLRNAVALLERDWRRWAKLRKPIDQCRLLAGEDFVEAKSAIPPTW